MLKKSSLLLCLALIFGACAKETAKFPTKNITLVVPYSPGGASDTAARIFGQLLEKKIGVPVVVENRTGGAGSVGLSYVQTSKPDGYTMAYMPVESVMIEALGYVKMKPSDFAFLGGGTIVPSVLTVKATSPWKTYDEFIAHIKANPEKVRIGNSGPGSIWHLAAAAIGEKEGVKVTHVPFDGGATAVAGLLGGHIEAVTVSENEVRSGVINKDLRILASLGEERATLAPDMPTLKELGKDLVVAGWGGFAVPAGTPKAVLDILIQNSEAVLSSQEFKDQVSERGLLYGYRPATDMQTFAESQYQFYTSLITGLGLNK